MSSNIINNIKASTYQNFWSQVHLKLDNSYFILCSSLENYHQLLGGRIKGKTSNLSLLWGGDLEEEEALVEFFARQAIVETLLTLFLPIL